MSKDKDPNEGLADDAVLATDLGDETERRAEQQTYYGGDPEEDAEDLDAADRGDEVVDEDKEDDRGDDTESEEESEGDEEGEGDEEEGTGEADADAESDEDASEDEEADASDALDLSDEDEDDEVAEGKQKDTGIPRHRFNEVNQRMKDAEARLAQLEKSDEAEEKAADHQYDFDKAEGEYVELLLDGKTSEAAAMRSEIRAAEKAEFKAEAKAETVAEIDHTSVENTVSTLSKEAEKMFPAFDNTHEDFNEVAVQKTLTFMRGYQSEGMQADDAFVSAIADTVELFNLVTEGEEQSDSGTKKTAKKAPIKKTKEKLATQKKQGKSPVGEGKSSADAGAVVPDVDQMSDEELDALPADTLARLRGDFG